MISSERNNELFSHLVLDSRLHLLESLHFEGVDHLLVFVDLPQFGLLGVLFSEFESLRLLDGLLGLDLSLELGLLVVDLLGSGLSGLAVVVLDHAADRCGRSVGLSEHHVGHSLLLPVRDDGLLFLGDPDVVGLSELAEGARVEGAVLDAHPVELDEVSV